MNMEQMAAGREMDVLVAEKVMGLQVVEDPANYRGLAIGEAGSSGHDVPHFSTDIAAAWRVVEKLAHKFLRLEQTSSEGRPLEYRATFRDGEFQPYGAFADTAALSICRAALKARMSFGMPGVPGNEGTSCPGPGPQGPAQK